MKKIALQIIAALSLLFGGCSELVKADRSKVPDDLYRPADFGDGGDAAGGDGGDVDAGTDDAGSDAAIDGPGATDDAPSPADSAPDAGDGGGLDLGFDLLPAG